MAVTIADIMDFTGVDSTQKEWELLGQYNKTYGPMPNEELSSTMYPIMKYFRMQTGRYPDSNEMHKLKGQLEAFDLQAATDWYNKQFETKGGWLEKYGTAAPRPGAPPTPINIQGVAKALLEGPTTGTGGYPLTPEEATQAKKYSTAGEQMGLTNVLEGIQGLPESRMQRSKPKPLTREGMMGMVKEIMNRRRFEKSYITPGKISEYEERWTQPGSRFPGSLHGTYAGSVFETGARNVR